MGGLAALLADARRRRGSGLPAGALVSTGMLRPRPGQRLRAGFGEGCGMLADPR